MKTFELQGTIRNNLGTKEAKNLRKEGKVPCVLYGGEKNTHFFVNEINLQKLIYTPEVYLVILKINGEEHKAIIKEIQFHPVTDRIIHIDFQEVFDDKPFAVELPIKVVGNSIGVKAGGKLQIKQRKLKVKGLLKDMPDYLEIDITNLNVGQSYKVGNLKFQNLQLLDSEDLMVVKIASTRAAKEAAEAQK